MSIDDPQLFVHELAYSIGVTAALVAAARLRVADAIGDAELRADEVAGRIGAHPEAVGQLLRALACRGVFRDVGGERYANTEASRLLCSDVPGSKRPMVLLAGAPFAWRMWSRLDDAVRTGDSVFTALYGKDLFAHLSEDEPELGALFDRAMAKSAEVSAAAVAGALDVTDVATVADIGGGRGMLLRALLERHRDLHGVLFDLPHVVDQADDALRSGDLAGRSVVMAGDCHRDIPVKADLYLLKSVVHMWDDDTAVAVLRRLSRSAPAGARIVVMEQLLDATPTPRIATVMDLLMLVSQGGRERTERQLRALFDRAGLEFRGVAPATPVIHMIEAVVPQRH